MQQKASTSHVHRLTNKKRPDVQKHNLSCNYNILQKIKHIKKRAYKTKLNHIKCQSAK